MAQVLMLSSDQEVTSLMARAFPSPEHQLETTPNSQGIWSRIGAAVPDLIVLDGEGTQSRNLSLCRALRRQTNLAIVPILFIAARRSLQDMEDCFNAGGDDYLCRPLTWRELRLRGLCLLRHARRQHADRMGHTLNVGDYYLKCERLLLVCGKHFVPLTRTERDLLRCLMSRPGQVFTAETLLQEVWGYHPGTGDPVLVRMHVHNLRHKIVIERATPRLIRTIARRGYTVEREQ